MGIVWHRHRIVPGHIGGTYEEGNILRCNLAMHAFMHEQLYKEHGRWQDKFAANLMKGGKGGCDWTGREHSEKTKQKQRNSYVYLGDRNAQENKRRQCILPELSNSLRDDGVSIFKTAEILGIATSSVKKYRRKAKEDNGG